MRDATTIIRPSLETDIPAIQTIYAHFVLTSCATFEESPPTVDEIAARREAVLATGLPHLVAVSDGQVAGYAYASMYRPRSAYRFTIEDSIYVAADMHGRGLGSALLAELLRIVETGPWQQIVAVIGDSANAGSIRIHERMGFRHVGTLNAVGYKFDRWIDTVLMQRALKP